MQRTITLFITLIFAAATLALGADEIRWLNVHVTEQTDDTRVEVRLPLSLVHAAISSVKTEEFHNGKVKMHLEDADVDLAALLMEIKKAPDGEYVKVYDKEADVVVTKVKGTILINVIEKEGDKAKVNVKIPAQILDAIRVDENNELDIKGVLSALETVGTGDLVTVDSPDAKVRVWIE